MSNRVLLGNLGSGVYGLKVSKPGVDVLTASSGDLLFDSSYPALQTMQILNLSFYPITAAGSTQSVYHGLGYKPMFLIVSESYAAGSKTLSNPNIGAYADNNYIYVQEKSIYGVDLPITINVRIHVLNEIGI